ncbi:hypothetical protein ABW21_db0202460 [Orbilia brochopaga]|nr:hypothetical protein ABW21_db0202460 [Drechslerella brochopaga]
MFPTETQIPEDVNYEPWRFFAKREKTDITLEILPPFEDLNTPPEPLASYRLHKRILCQSPTFRRYIQKHPTAPKITVYGEQPHIFKPLLAYFYLHDFLYLSHASSRFDFICDADKLLLPANRATAHESAFRCRMLYYIELYFLASRLELHDLCKLLVERYIAVHDVPDGRQDSSQDPNYKYSPFTLYNMSDFVKDGYIERVYGKGVAQMVIGDNGNLRWRVIRGVLARQEILQAFEFQLDDHPGFHRDVMEGLKSKCRRIKAGERAHHTLYQQYLGLVEWSLGLEERRQRERLKRDAIEASNMAEMNRNVGRLSFEETDKENEMEEDDDDEEL